MRWSAGSFWQYSLALYKHESVEAACLQLQDEHGLNVNLVLLCCFMHRTNRSMQTLDFIELLASMSESERQIRAHRLQRRECKSGPAHIYQQMLADELKLEKQFQCRLMELARPSRSPMELDVLLDNCLQAYPVVKTAQVDALLQAVHICATGFNQSDVLIQHGKGND